MYYRDAGIQITRQLLRVVGQAGEEECDGRWGYFCRKGRGIFNP